MHSPPRKPAASPEKKLDAASAHSSAVIPNLLWGGSDLDSLAECRPAAAHASQESGTGPGENESPSLGDFSRQGRFLR
jgi:hypothetical protein